MADPQHTGESSVPPDVLKATQDLWERNRLRCGWFLRADLVPETRDDLLRCLRLMARHGDRATFVLSRKLQKCL
jgi:hypothetical protein